MGKKLTDILPFRILCDENRNIVPVVALTAYLELKEIKKTYMIDNIDDSDSELDAYSDEDEDEDEH